MPHTPYTPHLTQLQCGVAHFKAPPEHLNSCTITSTDSPKGVQAMPASSLAASALASSIQSPAQSPARWWRVLRGSRRWQRHIVCVLALFHSFRFLLLFSFRASHSPFVLPSRGSFPLSFDKRLTFISVSLPSAPSSFAAPTPYAPIWNEKKTERKQEREREQK